MFLLGLTCGIIVAFTVVWIIAGDPPEQPAPVTPKQSIHEIERQAIREMVATAMVNGRIGKDPAGDGTGTQSDTDSS